MTESGRKPILFDRTLQPELFDFALAESCGGADDPALRRALAGYLGNRAAGAVTIEKTIRQLSRAVGPKSSVPREVLCAGLDAMSRLDPAQRDAERLRLLCLSNTFVADCVSTLLKLHSLDPDGASLAQLTGRMQDKYGDRGMVPRRVRYVLQTLVQFRGVAHVGRHWRPTEVLTQQSGLTSAN